MFTRGIDKRMKIILLIFSSILLVIVLRVFYVQVVDYKKLSTLASDLWSRNLPIEASRGRILDRNGVVLADNITTTSLVLIPNQIKNKKEVTTKLAEILGVSFDEMKEHVYKETSIERVHPEGRRLSYEVADKIEALNFDGVYLVKESKRYYPYEEMLSHVLGYVGIDNQGLSGIELQYDDYLTGENGAIKYFSDAKGNKLELTDLYIEPQDGMDLQLTIDINIQKSVERELDNVVDMFNPDMALAVVMDPKTGEILAMSSRPNFDPNNYQNYTQEELSRNLPIWASYEPGSTQKIVTTAAAVEEKVVDLFKDEFTDTGSVRVDTARIKCWKAGGHGHQTFLQVLQNSCNPGFVKMGQLLGKERLFHYLDLFGFGSKTGIDLNGEGEGIIFPLDQVGNIELATTAFGQGISVTPIQQITAISAVINGGDLLKPFVLKNILEPETGNVMEHNSKIKVRKVISEETSEIMRYALETVVALGGGKSAYIDGYRIGGKTGTAQKAVNGAYLANNYIMSFVGIVPSNDPEAVLYIAIDNPKDTALLSSYTTTPIARRILLDIIDALDIEKQEGGVEKDYEWTDKVYYEVADVVGKTPEEAKKLLEHFSVEYSGSGEKVVSQSPEAGTRLEDGSTVKLMLGN
ncbi:MAG TPA: stage V sporulation protein D [Candidatus Onthousia excrementipullorum]|uniref:Stage V sporulation protein D n=1 Tax=Candidatus Onthousia excrementipullorum TaxID=2840884 RepID=A0A9D1DV98_9FIRM|nr:stage V sporulation protein D [Candidatus Onthousia excrementipullorum]